MSVTIPRPQLNTCPETASSHCFGIFLARKGENNRYSQTGNTSVTLNIQRQLVIQSNRCTAEAEAEATARVMGDVYSNQ